MELKRAKISANIGTILLGPVSTNNAFHMLCKKHGATAVIIPAESTIITENSIAFISNKITKKRIQELETQPEVIGYCSEDKNIELILKNTKKPVIGWETTKGDLFASEKPKKGALLIAKSKTPEEIHSLMQKDGVLGIVINSTENPIIFEQYTNYVEKGYYNKVTRKRREKLVVEFEEISKKLHIPVDQQLRSELLKD